MLVVQGTQFINGMSLQKLVKEIIVVKIVGRQFGQKNDQVILAV